MLDKAAAGAGSAAFLWKPVAVSVFSVLGVGLYFVGGLVFEA